MILQQQNLVKLIKYINKLLPTQKIIIFSYLLFFFFFFSLDLGPVYSPSSNFIWPVVAMI
jgi:hypothetical protein